MIDTIFNFIGGCFYWIFILVMVISLIALAFTFIAFFAGPVIGCILVGGFICLCFMGR